MGLALGSHDLLVNVATRRGRLGAHVSSMTPELRKFFGAPESAGMLVQKVLDGTPAADAGLRVGDVLVKVDGDDVADLGDVIKALADRDAGRSVALVVLRKNRRVTLKATLLEPFPHSWSRSFRWSGQDLDGKLPRVPSGTSGTSASIQVRRKPGGLRPAP